MTGGRRVETEARGWGGVASDAHERHEGSPAEAVEAAALAAAVSERDDLFFVLDRDLRHVVFSHGYARAFRRRYGTEVAPGVPFAEHMPEDERAAVLAAASAALAGERVVETLTVEAGAPRTYETIWSPLQLGDGGIGGVVVRARDVTGRGQVTGGLDAFDARLRSVLEAARLGVNVLDLESGKYVFMSPTQVALTGFTQDEMNDLPAEEAYARCHPDDRHVSVEQQRRLLEGAGDLGTGEYRWRVKSGEYRWFRDSRTVLRDEHGVPRELVGLSADITEERRLRDELRDSEELFRTLFETMQQGVVIQDAEGRIVAANPAAEEIVGLTLSQMRGLTSFDTRWRSVRDDGSDFPAAEHPVVVALRTGRPVRGVSMGVFNPREEKVRWSLVSAVPQFRPGEDRPYQAFAVFTDVTQSREAEERLRLSETVRDRTEEFAGVGSAYIELPGGDGYWSRQLYRLFDAEEDSADGVLTSLAERIALIESRVTPGEMDRLRRVSAAVTMRDATRFELDVVHRDGGVHALEVRTQLERDAAGTPRAVYAFYEDVTAQRALQAALRESEDLFRSIFEGNTAGIATGSLDGRLLRVNRAFAAMLGSTPEQLEGTDISRLAVPGDEDLVARNQAAMIAGTCDEVRYRRRYAAADGSVVWGDVTASLRRGTDGEPLYFTSTIVDVTEQVAAAEEIARLQAVRESAEQVARMGSWRWDLATDRVEWSPGIDRIHDVDPGEFTGDYQKIIETRVLPEDRAPARAALAACLERGGTLEFDYRVAHRDGSVHTLQVTGAVPQDARGDRILAGLTRDVTELREAEEALRPVQATHAAQVERQRLARDLHDAVTQNLYSANLLLEVLPETIGREPAEAAADAATVHRLVRASLGELRTLLYELRPETIAGAPLAVLLARLGDALAGSGTLEVATAADDDLELPDDVHATLYRIAQEALANVGKHARASHVSAVVERAGDGVRLVVRDDGRGYDLARTPEGLGAGIMRERALGIGARLDVQTAPGAGTTVTVLWPAGSGEPPSGG